MAEQGTRIRVTLRWVQILDKLEPAFEEEGEFRFAAKISSKNRGGISRETRLPRKAEFYAVSDHPAWNRLRLDEVLFEGEVDDHLKIELIGEELDALSANDQLEPYAREFNGPVGSWLGVHGPGDEERDQENMKNWRVCYAIEKA
ncbi:MAG: hypothetical protein HY701_10655 [Gemmatimonadetes bacterium]|nr:hypothetical protein [Gemmatimonadota bacterium]